MNLCSISSRLIITVAAGLLIVCAGTASCRSSPGADSARRLYPAVVKIMAGDKMGSGVIVNNAGCALTSRHVVGDEKTVYVMLSNGVVCEGSVLAADQSKDLALVMITGGTGEFIYANLGSSAESDGLQIGDAVTIAGYPAYADSISPTLSEGIVCAFPKIESVGFIQSSAQVYPGSSGGPMINRFGEVIGVVNGKYTSVSAGCTTFATAAEEAIELMDLVYGLDKAEASDTGMPTVEQIPSSRACPNVGCKAPAFSLSGPDGEQVSIAACKGRKVLLVFAGSTCPGCSQLMQCVLQIYDAWPREQLEVLVIVSGESDAVVREWAAVNRIKCRVLSDPEGQVADLYRPAGLPAVYFIDAYGQIKIKRAGIVDNCNQEIDTLLRLY
ncbi:MAG: trypsin-like peptidase domain-containing protein [Dehalococcoidia bacterium]|jgi:peroxiredoxin